jgi:hypothetical protein
MMLLENLPIMWQFWGKRQNSEEDLAGRSLLGYCSGYLDHPFLKNDTQQEKNQAL